MRTAYIVSYDISDPKRLRAVYLTCRAFGVHIQYSVFRCDLSPLAKANMVTALDAIVNHHEDQVLFVPLGPADAAPDKAVESLGRPYTPQGPRARVF